MHFITTESLIPKSLLQDAVIETSLNSLKYIMEEEQQKTKLTKFRNSAICSRFSGTFTRLTMVYVYSYPSSFFEGSSDPGCG